MERLVRHRLKLEPGNHWAKKIAEHRRSVALGKRFSREPHDR
jgi:hypothetical protein